MKGKQLRSFWINGKEVAFNTKFFREMFLKLARNANKGIVNYEYELADALFVDRAAVHNWRMNVNGPGDIEKIYSLANFWNVNYENLLVEVKGMKTENTEKKQTLTECEKIAFRNVYRAFLSYMETFDETVGFVWNLDGSNYDIRDAYLLYDKLKYALKYEYVDLKRTVYDEIEEFIDGDLYRSLDGEFDPQEESMEEFMGCAKGMYEQWMGEFKAIIDPYLME